MSEPPNRTGRWERYLGPNPPPSSYIPRYRDLDTDQPIEDTKMIKFAEEIKSVLGKSLYLWQAHAIQKLLTGRDLLVKASTGAGKSLPYQAMALSRPGAVVLVVSPLIGLMNNQVKTLSPHSDVLPSVALTSETIEADPDVWKRVAAGEYRIVYATEQVILDKAGNFSRFLIKNKDCAFMKNLCLVAIDECHVIHEWQGFRSMYGYLGNLRLTLGRVPWLCVSATLTPTSSAYIAEVVKFRVGTFRISLPLHRDNINIVVAPVDGQSVEPLYHLIPENVTHIEAIPKTVIFVDAVDPAIDLVYLLARRLPKRFGRLRSSQIITAYYGDLDATSKSKIMEDFTLGRTRVVVCTDAFGLGIDIPDIMRCVQWQVNEKLNIARLNQRMGRCVRGKDLEGVSIVFASRQILGDVPKGQWEEAWREGIDGLHEVQEGAEDDDITVPISKNRKFRCFAIPVTRETEAQCKRFTSALYAKVDSLGKAIQQAASESTGTTSAKVSMSSKLDPPLLWFLTTEGCRHRVFGMIFGDPVLWTAKHRYWCCDNCAIASGGNLEDISTQGISPALSYANPSLPPKKLTNPRPKKTGPTRQGPITKAQKDLVLHRLVVAREFFWENLKLPNTIPEFVVPNKVLEAIARNVKRITNVEQLADELEAQGIRARACLLCQRDLNDMIWVMNDALSTNAEEVAGEAQLRETLPVSLPTESPVAEDQENVAPEVQQHSPPPIRGAKRPFSVLSMIQQTNISRDGHRKRTIMASSKALDNQDVARSAMRHESQLR